jgi:tetratricopeptide (TPR) repeat protein
VNSAVNPYIAGKALRDENGFFGRKATMEWVLRELRNPATNALVLAGQRRIGKTTLLLQLERALPGDVFFPIYFDLQDQARRPLGEVLADLADVVSEEVDLELSALDAFDDEGRYFRRVFLPRLHRSLGPNCRIVFLLDEFDVLDRATRTELPQVVATKTLIPFLRRVMAEYARLAFVFAVGRQAEDLSIDFTATFKSSLVREIWVLDRRSAEALVRQGEANGTLVFTQLAVDRILDLTSCHPYLTQLLCQRVWQFVYEASPEAVPMIDVPEVESVIDDTLETGDQALVWLWDGLRPAEKIYASALAEIADEGEIIPEDRVIQMLDDHAARLRSLAVELAPRDLVKRRILVAAGERGYSFAVELVRRWVQANRPLRKVKEELDQLNPLADQFYSIGEGFFRQQQWKDSVRYFRDALGENRLHFRARLSLGEALLELDQADDAVAELEVAYELDAEEARLSLGRALLAQAKARERAGNRDGAIEACDRALEVSPCEQRAHEMRAFLWTQQGDDAMERGDLEEALAAYQQAGAGGWEDAVVHVQRRLEKDPGLVGTQLHLGQVLLKLGNIDQGIARLQRAYQLDPEKARLPFTLALVDQARSARQAGNWAAAQDLGARIVQIDPANAEALEILSEAETALGHSGPSRSGLFGLTRQQLGRVLSSARKQVRLLGVVALDGSWELLVAEWAEKLIDDSDFKISVLCESDNMLFSKSLTYDMDSAHDRRSFRALRFIRDRALVDLPDRLLEAGVPPEAMHAQVSIEVTHLPIPISVIQVDDRVFANLWLHRVDDYFEQITARHPWAPMLAEYSSTYFDPERGRKYASVYGDEVLELFDHDRVPRGIYPRDSFYDTDYAQLVVWAFVFDREGRLLLHRRPNRAMDNRGMWDKSASGHIKFTDVDASRAVCREIIEELFSDGTERGYPSFARWAVRDDDMIYLGEWRLDQRRRYPFREIRGFDREWAFFRLPHPQSLYSPRILPDGTQHRIRVIADAFLFVAGPALTDASLGGLTDNRFRLIELTELKNVMDRALRDEQVPGFDASQPIPRFTPDLVNIMTGHLRDTLEDFSQYIKKYTNMVTE